MSTRSLTRSLAALAGAALTLTAMTACGSDSGKDVARDSVPSNVTVKSFGEGKEITCSYTADGQGDAKVKLPTDKTDITGNATAVLDTTIGALVFDIDATQTPCTAHSFDELAKQKFFDNTTCHRLTTQGIYVLQCGDPTGTGSGGPGYAIPDELDSAEALADDTAAPGAKNYAAGTVAMANAGPETGGSQFFLVYQDSPLPPNYTVFGKLDADSIKKLSDLAAQGTSDGGPDGAPKETFTIKSFTIG